MVRIILFEGIFSIKNSSYGFEILTFQIGLQTHSVFFIYRINRKWFFTFLGKTFLKKVFKKLFLSRKNKRV